MNLAFVLSIVAAVFGSGGVTMAANATTAVATDSEFAFGSAEGFMTLAQFNSIRGKREIVEPRNSMNNVVLIFALSNNMLF